MKHKRRSYLGSLVDAFSDGYNRSSHQSHQAPSGFVAYHDAQYHRNKHRKHAVKNVWHKVLGAIVLIFGLLCICGSCTPLW